MFVLPRSAGRAARSRATTVASYGGTQPSRILDPLVDGRPLVTSTSLIAIGTPASALAGDSPAARRRSMSAAASSASSRHLEEGVDVAIHRGDPVEVRLGRLDAR